MKSESEYWIDHWQEKEIVWTGFLPLCRHFEHIVGTDIEPHHLRNIDPGRYFAFQFKDVPHDVIPHFINPLRYVIVPIFRGIFRWIEKTDSVRFRIDNSDFRFADLFIERVSLGGN